MFQDNIYCHVTSGLGAGLFAVICGSPVDVVKSRMMGGLGPSAFAVRHFVFPGSLLHASCTGQSLRMPAPRTLRLVTRAMACHAPCCCCRCRAWSVFRRAGLLCEDCQGGWAASTVQWLLEQLCPIGQLEVSMLRLRGF